MSNIVFDDEMARIQRANAQTHDSVVRRNTVLEALNLRTEIARTEHDHSS